MSLRTMMIALANAMRASMTRVRRSVQTWSFLKPRLCQELVHGVVGGRSNPNLPSFSSVGRSRGESCRLAGATTQPNGIPWPSVNTDRLVPCFPRTIFGSSVERAARLHPLWQLLCGWVLEALSSVQG
jgi:hypothetical protein